MNAALASLELLRVLDPADEFIAAERGQGFPKGKYAGISPDRRLQILAGLMNRPMRKVTGHDSETNGIVRSGQLGNNGVK